MRRSIDLLLLLILLASSGCASLPPACAPPAQIMARAELAFGRNVGARVGVSEAAFAQFLKYEVTPRFPDGLTVLDARGQWRDGERGTLLREPSKIVLITFADDAQKRADLVAIAESYKRMFRQQSVMTSVRSACVSF